MLTTAAQAIEIKASGGMEVWGNWGHVTLDKAAPFAAQATKNNSFYQRNRFFFDIIASESLKGTIGLENNILWGKSTNDGKGSYMGGASGMGNGGGMGSRGVNIELFDAYIDWVAPGTDLKVRVGMQPFANPAFVNRSSMVVDTRMAGVVVSNQFTPNVGLVGFYFRPYDENLAAHNSTKPGTDGVSDRWYNTVDMFGLAVPLTFQGVTIAPWGAYGALGRDSYVDASGTNPGGGYLGRDIRHLTNYTLPVWGYNALAGNGIFSGSPYSALGGLDGQGNGWWLGLTGEITMWNPFRLAFDFNYGSTDFGSLKLTDGVDTFSVDCKRSGWYAAVLAEYKLDFMTPALTLWYASGDDDKVDNGSEMMPAVRPSTKYTTFGYGDSNWYNTPGNAAASLGMQGTWGAMIALKDISFMKDLKHNLRLLYSRGTNDSKMVWDKGPSVVNSPRPSGGTSGILYLTDKDSAWEFNLDSYYDIYKNLTLCLELGYIKLNLDDDVWGKKAANFKEDNGYKIALGLRYLF